MWKPLDTEDGWMELSQNDSDYDELQQQQAESSGIGMRLHHLKHENLEEIC
jgi:hypothetical protein